MLKQKKDKNISSQKPQIRFQCDPEFLEEIQKGIESSGFEVSEAGRALFDYFLHLSPENQRKILAYRKIFECLRIDPAALDSFREDIEQLLGAAELEAILKNRR